MNDFTTLPAWWGTVCIRLQFINTGTECLHNAKPFYNRHAPRYWLFLQQQIISFVAMNIICHLITICITLRTFLVILIIRLLEVVLNTFTVVIILAFSILFLSNITIFIKLPIQITTTIWWIMAPLWPPALLCITYQP